MHRFANNFKTTFLMACLMGLLLGIGYLIGGRSALLPALIIGGMFNFFGFFFSDKIALATMKAKAISRKDDPVVWDSVKRLSHQAGLPMPRVYLSPASAANAFATGRGPNHAVVCVTAGLRKILNEEELEGVIAHELSHIKNRDMLLSTIAAVVAGAISWLTYLAFFTGGNDENSAGALIALLLMILAPIAAMLIQLAISRSREFEADRSAAELSGTGRGLANALRKLAESNRRTPLRVPDSLSSMFTVAPLTGGSMKKLFMTHPPVRERITRLMETA
ncbi:MAG: M48 family metalloprotease [Spirochaetota bacterium]